MNNPFITFLIEDTEKMPPVVKKTFLRMLKLQPHIVLVGISENLADWGMHYCMTKREPVRCNPGDGTAELILASWQEHYKVEIDKITA